ncbi:MAG: heme exporter protein CcmB [Bacillota bacterium]|nr:heme exporter protein CcmB [Bacillota bacterium]
MSGRTGWWQQVTALVWKELRAEVRTRETLTPMVVFALVVVTVFGFGLRATGADLEPVFPGLLWISFYFVGLLGLGRSFSSERAQETLPGLLLVPADRSFIFVGKALANLVFLGVVELVSLPLFFGLLGVSFTAPFVPFCVTIILGTVGFASIGTLLSALAAHTRAAEMLLPVLVFPILIPAVIGAVEATASLLGVGDPLAWRRWLGLLLAYDALFVALPMVLFDYLVEP